MPAYEPEDLQGRLKKRQRLEGGGGRRMRLEVGGGRLENSMLGLVERAVEEMMVIEEVVEGER